MEPARINNFQNSSHIRAEMSLKKNAVRILRITANPYQMILAHSKCISSRMQLECRHSRNIQNAVIMFRMHFECHTNAARSNRIRQPFREHSDCIRAAFEALSNYISGGIRTAIELHSYGIRTGFEVACHFDSPSNEIRMCGML